jgi:hypothetical protein
MVMADTPAKYNESLAAVRSKLEQARQRLSDINRKMDSYDKRSPAGSNSPESQQLESEYASSRAEFDRLQTTEREQAADPTQADGSSTAEELAAAQDQVRERLRLLNRRIESSEVARMGSASPTGKMLAQEIDYLNTEYQRLDGLRRQMAGAQSTSPKTAGTAPAVAPIKSQPPTTAKSAAPPAATGSSGSPDEEDPSSQSTTTQPADSTTIAAKFDFVDATFYISLALLLDIICLIPIAGSVLSVLSIMGFGLWFYIKGFNDPIMRFGMVITGGAELVPVVSSVLPGITAYVVLVLGKALLADQLKRVAPVVETIAKSRLAPPQVRAGAAVVALAAKTAEKPKTTATGSAATDAAGGAGTGTDSAGAFSASMSSAQSGRSKSFGASMNGSPATEAALGPGEKADSFFDFKSENPYAAGTPLASGSPYAGVNESMSRIEEKKKKLTEKEKTLQK